MALARDPAYDGPRWRVLRTAAVTGITVTGLVHWFLLRPLLHLHGADLVADKLLHLVVPILAVVGLAGVRAATAHLVGEQPARDRLAAGLAGGDRWRRVASPAGTPTRSSTTASTDGTTSRSCAWASSCCGSSLLAGQHAYDRRMRSAPRAESVAAGVTGS